MDNKMINFYTIKKVKDKAITYENPNFENVQMSHPFRSLVIAPSGTGKTNFLLNLISRMSGTFTHIYLCSKITDEPLYDFLGSALKDQITMFNSLDKFPEISQLSKDITGQTLIIFDDMINEKNLDKPKQLYMMGRKLGLNHCGCSTIFLSQSYFQIPKFIRQNTNYIIILKVGGKRDLALILSEFSTGLDIKELQQIYKSAIREKFDFLKIDCQASDENKRFSHNFTDFFQIE